MLTTDCHDRLSLPRAVSMGTEKDRQLPRPSRKACSALGLPSVSRRATRLQPSMQPSGRRCREVGQSAALRRAARWRYSLRASRRGPPCSSGTAVRALLPAPGEPEQGKGTICLRDTYFEKRHLSPIPHCGHKLIGSQKDGFPSGPCYQSIVSACAHLVLHF